MAFTKADFENDLRSITMVGVEALEDLEKEFAEINLWIDNVEEIIRRGNVTHGHLLPKTPAKKRGVLGTIRESVSNISLPESPETGTVEKQHAKKKSKQGRGKRKQDLSVGIEELVEEADDSLTKRRRTETKVDSVIQLGNDLSVANAALSSAADDNEAERNLEAKQRRTRSQAKRITLVKETRQTFVFETIREKSKSIQAPVLESPSPVRSCEDSAEDVFKSPLSMEAPSITSDESTPPTPEVKPAQRMTRTKTRAMAKAKEAEKKAVSPIPEKKSETGYTSGQDSDEYTLASTGSNSKLPVSTFLKQKFGTPVGRTFHASSAQLGTPTASNLLTNVHSFISKPGPASVKKVREKDYLLKLNQKTAEVIKKREELMKAQTEEKMRKRQEKTMKVNAAREAMEKERAEKLRLQLAEEERKMKEEAAKRRKLQQQKAAEAAKLLKRQQEEEQRRVAEERRRKQEEAERLRKEAEERGRIRKEELERERLRREEAERERLRREEAERERLRKESQERERLRKEEAERGRLWKEEALKAVAAKAAEASEHLNETYVKPSTSYAMTPMPAIRQPVAPKSADDYGIEDARCDDSSDDETNPKKKIPVWAEPKNRARPLTKQCDYIHGLARIFFESKKTTPDLSKMFKAIDRRLLIRKSSAVWNTPPIKFNKDP